MGSDWGTLKRWRGTRGQPSAACVGKEPFDSFRLADGIAKSRSRHGKRNHVYRCGSCNKFHLGSPPPKAFRHRQLEDIEA